MKLISERMNNLENILRAEVDAGKITGCSVEIGDRKGSLYRKCFGDMKEESRVSLCSMTKPITSVLASQLLEEGILSPVDEVGAYLPPFKDVKVAENGRLVKPHRPMLVRNLLDMTSGLAYPQVPCDNEMTAKGLNEVYEEVLADFEAGKTMSFAEACERLAKAPLAFHPGEAWAYGFSADVLGAVMERATGIPYHQLLKERVLDPLKMEHTGFLLSEEELSLAADIVIRTEEGRRVIPGVKTIMGKDRPLTEMPYVTSAGGAWPPEMGRGLYSTLDDYARFARMLLNMGTLDGTRILSPETVKTYSIDHLNAKQRSYLWKDLLDGYGYGNLMRVMTHPEMRHSNGNAGEYGWDGYLGTYFFVDPAAGIYLVYYMQGNPDFTVRGKIRQIVYAAIDRC